MGFFSRKKDEVKKEKSSFGFSKPISSTPYVPNVVGDDDNDWPTKPPKKQQASGRDRFKPRNGPKYPPTRDGNTRDGFRSRQTRASMQILAALPPAVLERIFTFICPHSQDESYETCEQSAVDDACMLCDLRDLAYAGLACKKWRASAIKVMYHSIRIDKVHYCHREAVLADRRKRGTFLERNAVPEDTARTRLILLSRSVREDPTRLGRLVQFLKVPYMLREAAQADLARTIAVLPNLRYVDLPEGMFADEPPYATLRLEVEARCPEMRRMTYLGGSEHSLAKLASGHIWTRLETLELKKVDIDAAALRHTLGALMRLRALKVTECPAFVDDFFRDYEGVAPLPALAEFILSKAPATTWVGICAYLSRPQARKTLKVLTLAGTGVSTSGLHQILCLAPALEHVSIIESIDAPFQSASSGQSPTPRLSSKRLRTFHYEITASAKAGAFAASAVQSHYDYLASSILGGGLPNLEQLYVRDPSFPEALLGLPPPVPPAFAGEGSFRPRAGSAGMLSKPTDSLYTSGAAAPRGEKRPLSLEPPRLAPNQSGNRNILQNMNNPFAQPVPTNIPETLEVFTKDDDDLDWSSLQMAPGGYGSQRRGSHSRTKSGSRPVSSYGLGADIMGGGGEWVGAGATRSVMVGDGAGGFLAVPGQGDPAGRRRGVKPCWGGKDDDLWPGPRPKSRAWSGDGRMDLWR